MTRSPGFMASTEDTLGEALRYTPNMPPHTVEGNLFFFLKITNTYTMLRFTKLFLKK